MSVLGGRNRTRTCDPIDVNDMLYQLSHATLYCCCPAAGLEPAPPRFIIHRMREAPRSIDVNDMHKKKDAHMSVLGGRNRTRTCDLIDVNDMLYQLSHATVLPYSFIIIHLRAEKCNSFFAY